MQAAGPWPVCMMYTRQMDRPLVFSLSANRLCAMPRVSDGPWIIAGRPCRPLLHPTPIRLQINVINTYISPLSPLYSVHLPIGDRASAAVMAKCCRYGYAHAFIIKLMAPLRHLWCSATIRMQTHAAHNYRSSAFG